MDWLRDFTKNWQLKTSFMLYLTTSLLISVPLSFFCQYILQQVRKEYMLSRALSSSKAFLDKLMFSDGLAIFIDAIPILLVLVFIYLFFNLFYKHKIQSVLDFLDHYEEMDIKDKNELSDKVFQLSQENNELKKENFINIRNIHELSKKMDTILHEIKNPLAVLSGDIEMLNTNYKTDDERVERILARMTRSEKRIHDYVHNLQIGQNVADLKLEIETIEIGDLLRIIQKELDYWKYNISFTYDLKDLSQTIKLDSDRFMEGLANILKNSETHAKSQISLGLYENEDYFIIEIEDDGRGFSQEALANYNKPYFSENPLVGNMGLGLYITDEIMKKQGIKMVLTNTLGANTKLFIKKS